jgi:hypothetical protein
MRRLNNSHRDGWRVDRSPLSQVDACTLAALRAISWRQQTVDCRETTLCEHTSFRNSLRSSSLHPCCVFWRSLPQKL